MGEQPPKAARRQHNFHFADHAPSLRLQARAVTMRLAVDIALELSVADTPDRRLPLHKSASTLKREINGAQLATLNTLERFGWNIRFLRRTPGAPAPLVVLHDPDTHKYAVLDADGELDENPVWERFRG